MSRRSWDEYFFKIAREVATRATCDRKHVGCVFVHPDSKTILATGYNGAPRGLPHCDDVGHDLANNSCQRVVHAEINAIASAARHGSKLDGATVYVTCSPCWQCLKVLINAGVRRVVFAEPFYRDVERITEAASAVGIELVRWEEGAERSAPRDDEGDW